ncbi:MAG: glycoside hydrolase family 9 protein [Candidatus Sulfotelmatobacter sp.]|jgi:endoglucanase
MSLSSNRPHSILNFLLLTCLFLTALPIHAVTGYIRVNQIGYEAGLSMRAYLMTTSAVSGASYVVKNSAGSTVASGTAGATLGAWGTYSIYPIDFNLSTADTYTILVSGPVSATSPSFRVDTPANLYATPLANNLYFYENERDGPNFIPTPLRTAAGHLNDASATVYSSPMFNGNDLILGSLSPTGATINAEGGWWDAGDYLKFVQTHSYVVALMLIGVRDFPNQMGSLSTTSNFTNEAQFGVNWLQQMWNDSTETLYYQVGIGTDFKSYDYLSDHDIWRLPQADDTYGGSSPVYQYIRHRPVFVAGAAGSTISPNLAGRLSADFAECFQVFDATNAALANQCILEAEHIFDLANTAPSGNLLTTAPYDFYSEIEWRDDLELGATELYFALQRGNLPPGLPHTDPMYYLTAAANWAHAYITGPNNLTDTLNLYDVSGLAHFELYRAITLAGNPAGLAVSKTELLNDIKDQMTTSIAQADDPFGFGWPWSSYDTISHGAGLSVMAKEYSYLTNNATFATDSERWLGNISGANAWGVTFTVGDGDTFPDCMQHQVANLVGSLNGQPPVLSGAVVEGPTNAASSGLVTNMLTCPPGGGDTYKKFNGNGAVYKDNVQSYSTDEPAIDLTAASFLMYAWRIAGAPSGTP